MQLKISAVIPAFNEEKLLPRALASVRRALPAFAEHGWEVEMIVCDNNSTDRTAEIARVAGAKVVFEPVNQIARARNTGATAASGDWLIFVDADSEPSRKLFSEVAGQIRCGKCVGGGATIRPDIPTPTANCAAAIWNSLSRWCAWAPGLFVFCETAAFRQIGGFNEQRFAGEDVDFSRRLKRFARVNGRTVVILAGHPIITSARKLQLYRRWDFIRFLAKTLFTCKRTLADKKECYIWYDGRR
jgi:glycosyltransferase involved in cell wall biosynthesis